MFGLLRKTKHYKLELDYQALKLSLLDKDKEIAELRKKLRLSENNVREKINKISELEKMKIDIDVDIVGKEIAELGKNLRLSENNLKDKINKISELEKTINDTDVVLADINEALNLQTSIAITLSNELESIQDINRTISNKLTAQAISHNLRIEEMQARYCDELEKCDSKKTNDKNRVIRAFLKKGMQIYHRNNDVTNGLGGHGYIEIIDITDDLVMCNVKGEIVRFSIDMFGTILSPNFESRNTDNVVMTKVNRPKTKEYEVDSKFWPPKELGGRYHR